jgi:diadenosine tetraphosphatase ApaH/serine/threonine PP2A family protein phosphatase
MPTKACRPSQSKTRDQCARNQHEMTSFVPSSGVSVQLLGGRQWLVVLGSVGQPRDENPAASFAMLDTATKEITYCRVPYDIEAAANRIRANGLPRWLADRLAAGR